MRGAGLGLFAVRNCGTVETVGRNYGTLIYSSLVDEKQNWKACGEGTMSVTVQMFAEWAIRIPEKVTDGTGTEQATLIVLAAICDVRYVNEARYFSG